MYRILFYRCGDAPRFSVACDIKGEDGKWIGDSVEEFLDQNGTVLVAEPLCPGMNLATTLTSDGDSDGELICDIPLADVSVITYPNTCMFLCDMNPVMTIYSDWNNQK